MEKKIAQRTYQIALFRGKYPQYESIIEEELPVPSFYQNNDMLTKKPWERRLNGWKEKIRKRALELGIDTASIKLSDEQMKALVDRRNEQRMGVPPQVAIRNYLYCNFCDSCTEDRKLCTGCYSVVYCNQKCQTKDWDRHCKECIRFY